MKRILPHLLNYREGFACNSSSTHSVVMNCDFVTDQFMNFGWQRFQVAPKDVNIYLAAAILGADPEKYNPEEMAEALGINSSFFGEDTESYVDHQSSPFLIVDPNTGLISTQFVKELLTWFTDHNAGIFGGNDNDDGDRADDPRLGGRALTEFPQGQGEGCLLVGRKFGDTWTALFSATGEKIRFSLVDNPSPILGPELVDLKITDYCAFGCPYCYQNSTKEGKPAELSKVLSILKDCAEAGVLEIAFGGGEPTTHPNFREIVEYTKSLGMFPNVTTRNKAFMTQVVGGQWDGLLGAVAFSVDKLREAQYVAASKILAWDRKGCPGIYAQIVDGVIKDREQFLEILDTLEKANVTVTWLGYKTTGRGKAFKLDKRISIAVSFVEDVLSRDEYWNSVRVDTAMLARYSDVLQEKYGKLGYSLTVTEEEGVCSCYIDAVTGTIADSSYTEVPPAYRKVYHNLAEQFPTVRAEKG